MVRWIACMVLALAAAMSVAGASERYGDQKVVYHISFDGGDSGKAYTRALINAQNHIDAVGQDRIRIAVVMHGDGVDLLKEAKSNSALQTRITQLKAKGVKFEVCNNTLTNRKINYSEDLFGVSEKDIVQSGVAEVVRLQQEGYSYLRP